MRYLIFLILLGIFALPSLAQNELNPEEAYEIALQRIEEARVTGETQLRLSSLGLESLPDELWDLEQLEILELSYNLLSVLPPEIGQLSQLRYLYLYGNHLEQLPKEIGLLTNLCYLQVNENQLRVLPFELSNLERLISGENCDSLAGYGLYAQANPLISPPQAVIDEGTAAILTYLRNEAWWHLQRLIAGAAGSVGIVAALVLGLRWKSRRGRKEKEKRG